MQKMELEGGKQKAASAIRTTDAASGICGANSLVSFGPPLLPFGFLLRFGRVALPGRSHHSEPKNVLPNVSNIEQTIYVPGVENTECLLRC